MSEPQTKKRKAYFRKLFYQKWGNYQNYFKSKKPKKRNETLLKVCFVPCPLCGKKAERVGVFVREKGFVGYLGLNCPKHKEKADWGN